MRININSPSFISFLETITETITTSVNVENYFLLAQDKKMNVLYVVFKLMKNSTTVSYTHLTLPTTSRV